MPSPMSRTRAERPEIVGEEAVQHVGRDAHLERVVAPPALVAPQHLERADVEPEPVRVDDRLGQRRGVAKAEIEALPGDRMDAVRGVAEQREARPHEIARQRQAERIGAARAPSSSIAPSRWPKRRSSSTRNTKSSLAHQLLARRRFRSVQTSDERLPLSGRMANGPPGRKCSTATPSCGRSWPTVATIAVCG